MLFNSPMLPAEGLSTVEGSHLNRDSAERWSAEFLNALTPLLPPCLN